MRYGLNIFCTSNTMQPDELGKELEERGFDSLWVAEHTHIPSSLETPRATGRNLGPEYWQCYDPFLSLAIAATATTRLRLATGVCLLTQRDPIVTAKEVATLDRLSGGRVDFGIGAGWNVEELANHGTAYRTRFSLMRERILAMKAIWTQQEAQFDGQFVRLSPMWLEPKPVQAPHPPIWMGGSGRIAIRYATEFADAWIPTWSPETWPKIRAAIPAIRAGAAGAGRTVEFGVLGPAPDAAMLDELVQAGVTIVALGVADLDREALLRQLEAWESLPR